MENIVTTPVDTATTTGAPRAQTTGVLPAGLSQLARVLTRDSSEIIVSPVAAMAPDGVAVFGVSGLARVDTVTLLQARGWQIYTPDTAVIEWIRNLTGPLDDHLYYFLSYDDGDLFLIDGETVLGLRGGSG